ncbi:MULTISPECIES: Phasin [unclassified Paracoccus (in: a-proteobacteria)]|uniref:Phasin n=1 Tax=unclassified Paracoccus (in: a-proteobacteria) TaxID=2688777 RepID=UPI0016039DFD|nr:MULTISPECIES: Phasin [unclassified Paracoccus (in: a-proteobacteria)]MBB1492828.1 Phasin [Paracoccus sp. MC1854]MBB1499178.1 Phasin [Paracoccus sp. MC1862]QQO45787.1 Phasin [Paracoccus sp. MC1862]
MAKTPDFTKTFQDMMANFPVDTSSMSEAFKTQAQLSERMTRVALQAAERSTEISAAWAKDTLSRMGELTTSKEQPGDYAKAMSDFASAAAELAAEHMAAYAEVAKKVQMDTVDLLMNAGKEVQADAQRMAQTATSNLQNVARQAQDAATSSVNPGINKDKA